jgi:carboxyl-terminal processing protease
MVKRRPLLCVLVVLFLVAIGLPVTADGDDPLTEEQRQSNLESFDHVWTTIDEKHWEERPGGLDWQAVRDELRPHVEQAATTDEARRAIYEMIERLGQSHFAIIPAQFYEELNFGSGSGTTGIVARVIDGRAIVISIDEDSPAADAGVRPGWVVLRVGKEWLEPKIAELSQEFAGSLYRDLVLASSVNGRLSGPIGEQVTVQFLDGRGRKIKRKLSRVEQPGNLVTLGFMPPVRVWIHHRPLEDDLGYIAFNMFIDPGRLMPTFNEAMQEFLETDGLVIDLRGNPGGIIAMGMGMAGWFIDEKDRRLGTMFTKDQEVKVVVFPRPETYDGPLAILVDGLSGSCSEIFAGGLQDLGRARIFGSRTAGAVLPSVIEKLPNGDGFQYAFANYVSQGGEELEGQGVIPDQAITPTREALLEGRDEVLEAAIAWIRTQQERMEAAK